MKQRDLEGPVTKALGRQPSSEEMAHAAFRFMIAWDDAQERGLSYEKAERIALHHGILSVGVGGTK